MGILRQYEIKHYGGLDADKPSELPWGDTYFADDTKVLYKYDKTKTPVAINGTPEGVLPISQSAQNFSTFTNGTASGDLAYAYESQGTSWLPGTLGGDYYPSGFYVWDGAVWVSDKNAIAKQLEVNKRFSEVAINQNSVQEILSNPLDSSKIYIIDGIVDLTGLNLKIEVPQNGISLKGSTFDVSKLVCSDNNYTMFTSPVGGSGNVLAIDLAMEVTGTNSKVFDLVSSTGFDAFEFTRVNWNNCTSLGVIDNYRQGLETGTGRFGGMPELELKGAWVGGYFIETSIVRGLTDGSYYLYKAGAGFVMQSRFRSNQNIDLNNTVGFLDFSATNFPNSNTLQLESCLVTRNGNVNADDSTIIPNITQSELPSLWRNNNGLNNTFVGGELKIATEVTTTIVSPGVFVDLAGTYTPSNLEHFDSPSNGQLRHLGNSPREYKVDVNMILDCNSNNEVDLRVVVWDDSASAFVNQKTIRRVINNFQGGRDVAYYTFHDKIILDTNDYVKMQVANISTTDNITAELDSEFSIEER